MTDYKETLYQKISEKKDKLVLDLNLANIIEGAEGIMQEEFDVTMEAYRTISEINILVELYNEQFGDNPKLIKLGKKYMPKYFEMIENYLRTMDRSID